MGKRNKKISYPKNGEIRSKKVRLVGDNVKQRITSRTRALKEAKKKDLDLVMVAPNAKPPVCKIMDYNKFIYRKKKKQKAIKAKSAKTEVKEIRFTPHTEEHDFNFKTNHARKFIEEGSKVKAFVQFKGRAIIFKDQGREMLRKLTEELEDIARLEHEPKMEGRRMIITLTPDKKKN